MNRAVGYRALALAGMLSCGCTGAAVGAQGRFAAVHNTLLTLGLNQVGHISEGSLGETQTARFPMDLEAQCYTFVAFGSDGARDLDLALLGADNSRVAQDSSHDTQSSIRHCVTTRGRYVLAVHMASGNGAYLVSSWRGGPPPGAAAQDSTAGTCGSPLPLALGQTVTGSTQRARAEHDGTCLGGGGDEEGGGADAPEVVYALTIERRQQVTVSVEQEGDYDGAVYLRRTCDEADSEVPGACNDDEGDTSHSRLSVPLDPGQYFIFVDGFSSSRGRYSMTVTAADVPSPAEVCQNAEALAPNIAVQRQTTAQDFNIFQATCANGARGPDHVFRLEVPAESRLQLHQESDYNGALYLRRACSEASSQMECNDNAEDEQHSRINAVVPAGTYYVFTDSPMATASGSYTLEADLAPVAGGNTPGDTCADAQPITPGTAIDGNTFQARDDVPSPCAAPQDGYDVVYRLDLTARSRVQLWLESADIGEEATIALTRNCAQIAQNNIACRAGVIGERQGLDQVLDPGHYFVVIDSAQPRRFGHFRLQSRVEDVGAMERLCRTAPVLTPGRTVTGSTTGTDHFQARCGGNARSPENLYRLVIRRRSQVTLSSTTTGHDGVLHLRQTCLDANTERGCNDDAGDTQHSVIEVALDPGTYTVFMDGFSASNSGSYTLEAQVRPL